MTPYLFWTRFWLQYWTTWPAPAPAARTAVILPFRRVA
jgi:hypothetical protein